MKAHICHAVFCETPIPPRLFMCRKHWYALPKEMRDRIWALYVPGQEITKTPSREYLEAARAAQRFLFKKECEQPTLF